MSTGAAPYCTQCCKRQHWFALSLQHLPRRYHMHTRCIHLVYFVCAGLQDTVTSQSHPAPLLVLSLFCPSCEPSVAAAGAALQSQHHSYLNPSLCSVPAGCCGWDGAAAASAQQPAGRHDGAGCHAAGLTAGRPLRRAAAAGGNGQAGTRCRGSSSSLIQAAQHKCSTAGNTSGGRRT